MSSPTDNAAARAGRAARFSGLARGLSWLAAAGGIAVAGLFFYQAGLFAVLTTEPAAPPPVIDNPDQISATDSTVKGVDRQNQPYEISARKGWQDEAKPNLVHLEDLTGSFRKPDGRVYLMSSVTGLYDTKLKAMDLAGKVVITEGSRFTARMEKAKVLVDTKSLQSDSAVDVTFADGTIAANGLQITDDGSRILFLNGVKARFGVAGAKGDQPQ